MSGVVSIIAAVFFFLFVIGAVVLGVFAVTLPNPMLWVAVGLTLAASWGLLQVSLTCAWINFAKHWDD